MKIPFREYHLLRILEDFELTTAPLDAHLSNYFRNHKGVGSKDRKFIADTIYGIIRWKGLLDAIKKPANWKTRYEIFKNFPTDTSHFPEHIQVSFPKWYYEELRKHYGEKTKEICLVCNETAPTTVRVNLHRTQRDSLLKKWKNFDVSITPSSPIGIRFHQKINFFACDEFKEGLFEIQDEGSQLIALEVNAKPGEQILDYCAGSGGKTLGFAPFMQGKGQIYLHDIRKNILATAKKRLKRAGIQNGQVLSPTSRQKNALVGKMDAVLIDVPCSGSGTLRRNPDVKWRFEKKDLEELLQVQKEIFKQSISFAKPGGRIIYATCSIFPSENERQVEFFTKNYPVVLKSQKSWIPVSGGMDGFFMATFDLLDSR